MMSAARPRPSRAAGALRAGDGKSALDLRAVELSIAAVIELVGFEEFVLPALVEKRIVARGSRHLRRSRGHTSKWSEAPRPD